MSPGPAGATATDIVRLRQPATVRERCRRVLGMLERGEGRWRVHRDRLPSVAEKVAEVTRAAYPDLAIPVHGRWSHFTAGGVDRPASLPWAEGSRHRGRMAIGLVTLSVLLDAGAGTDWRYVDRGGRRLGRSEGLAVATLEAFVAGSFSADGRPAADADGLSRLSIQELQRVFQADGANPLVGLEGRLRLLHRLAGVARGLPDEDVGGLHDVLASDAPGGRLPADRLLLLLLEALSPLWPDSTSLHGRPLGDVWPHSELGSGADALVPFHKLVQWLAYSLVEPLRMGGIEVVELDRLTGLAEYRNGGLLVDGGVLEPRQPGDLEREWAPGDPLVVEWRAATVALLDEVADLVREALGRPDLTLGQVLEGGTWRAGRELAEARRAGGAPPLRVRSDGTLF